MARQLPGEQGNILVATNGVRTEVVEDMPEWATLYWYLHDDPTQRADWNRLRGYSHTPPNKLSRSDA